MVAGERADLLAGVEAPAIHGAGVAQRLLQARDAAERPDAQPPPTPREAARAVGPVAREDDHGGGDPEQDGEGPPEAEVVGRHAAFASLTLPCFLLPLLSPRSLSLSRDPLAFLLAL